MQSKLNVIVGAIAIAASGAAMAQDAVVKIGHVGPTSGAIAHLGKDNELGAKMAIDELNAKGVTIGGKKVKFELLAEDDAGDPKQGTAAAQKLVRSVVPRDKRVKTGEALHLVPDPAQTHVFADDGRAVRA